MFAQLFTSKHCLRHRPAKYALIVLVLFSVPGLSFQAQALFETQSPGFPGDFTVFENTESTLPERQLEERATGIENASHQRLQAIFNILLPIAAFLCLFLLGMVYWNRKLAAGILATQTAERRLKDMTERLQTGVFQFRQKASGEMNVEFTNEFTRDMARWPSLHNAEIMQFFDYIEGEDRGKILNSFNESLTTGEPMREAFRFRFPGGELGWILGDMSKKDACNGEWIWSGYLFDLTSERLLNEELSEVIRSRDEFISMAIHELRSPVQNIMMAMDSVDPEFVHESNNEHFYSAVSAAHDLEHLVSDIVEMTSMKRQPAVLKKTSFNLNAVVNTVCRSFRAQADYKGIALKLELAPDDCENKYGDVLRIKQLLYNIIGNAIKYTSEGSVTVSVGCVEGTKPADVPQLVEISVRDSGIGIAESDINGIFEPFATVGPASRQSSGLGLALCRHLATLMGGTISVDSVQGQGSVFKITLPLSDDTVDMRRANVDLESVSGKALWFDQSETILVVDDNMLVREILSALLTAKGWGVLQAEHGAVALDMLLETQCKAVITDQQMPAMSGVELACAVKSQCGHGQRRPVLIMMTGGLSDDVARQATEVFDAILYKPIKAGQIDELINIVIQDQSSQLRGLEPV